MNYYTSDLHLGHANIIRFCNRPFENLDAMNEALIANWNARVTPRDTVYIIGDFMYRIGDEAELLLGRLRGQKHLILGNHDSAWTKKVPLEKYFQSVARLSVINTGFCKATLCHYPMMSFEGRFLIHGHIHNQTNDTYWPLLRTMENALNTSVEVNDYRPVSFDELVANNKTFRENTA
jgi:calcineurin-like phosphoesterase family protein